MRGRHAVTNYNDFASLFYCQYNCQVSLRLNSSFYHFSSKLLTNTAIGPGANHCFGPAADHVSHPKHLASYRVNQFVFLFLSIFAHFWNFSAVFVRTIFWKNWDKQIGKIVNKPYTSCILLYIWSGPAGKH